jgi:hypothetical protein
MKTNIAILAVLVLTVSSYAGNDLSDNKVQSGMCTIDTSVSINSPDSNKILLLNEYNPKQVIKLNLSQLGLASVSLQYEYAFHKNMSGALGVSLMLPSSELSSLSTQPDANSSITETPPKYNGWSITPEFRFYTGKKKEHQAPHGFYIAPYFRYASYNVTTTLSDDISGTVVDLTGKYSGFTGGLMIGSQWLIGKHFSIDWWIAGAGYGKGNLKLDAVSPNGNLSQQDQDNYKAQIKNGVDQITKAVGGTETAVTTTSNSVSANVGLPMVSLRGFGLCLGFYF